MSTATVEAPQGRRVLRRGIWRWEAVRPVPTCIECDLPIPCIDDERCERCQTRYLRRIAKHKAAQARNASLFALRALRAHPALRTICPDCDGLTYIGETCICVRIWMRDAERAGNLASFGRAA